jgi:hypothetical protein
MDPLTSHFHGAGRDAYSLEQQGGGTQRPRLAATLTHASVYSTRHCRRYNLCIVIDRLVWNRSGSNAAEAPRDGYPGTCTHSTPQVTLGSGDGAAANGLQQQQALQPLLLLLLLRHPHQVITVPVQGWHVLVINGHDQKAALIVALVPQQPLQACHRCALTYVHARCQAGCIGVPSVAAAWV